jgi:hypothetical protein
LFALTQNKLVFLKEMEYGFREGIEFSISTDDGCKEKSLFKKMQAINIRN